MPDEKLPPAVNGTTLWLQAIHAELRALRDLMTPAAVPEPTEGTTELREPASPAPQRKPATKRTRR